MLEAAKYYSSLKQYFEDEHLLNFIPLLSNGQRRISRPIRYLLLYNFLQNLGDIDVRESNKVINVFGSGPWSCKNSVCKHFGRGTITKIEVDKHKKNRVKGTLHCEYCGMIYTLFQREGSNDYSETIVEYGKRWADFVQRKLDKGVSRRALCKILGMSKHAIIFATPSRYC